MQKPVRLISAEDLDRERRKYYWRRAQKTYQFVYGNPFPTWYTVDIWAKNEQFAYEDYSGYFSRDGHKPIMLVDGELENQADKQYYEQLHSAWAEPKQFVRLIGSDHYINTAQSFGLMFYDRGVMRQLVDEIVNWTDKTT